MRIITLLFILSLYSCSSFEQEKNKQFNLDEVFNKSRFSSLSTKEIKLLDSLLEHGTLSDTLTFNSLKALACTYSYSAKDSIAENYFNKALTLEINKENIYSDLVLHYGRKRDFTKALFYSDLSLKNDPERFESKLALCEILIGTERYFRAIEELLKLYERDSLNYYVNLNISYSYLMINNLEQADVFIKKAIAISPECYECKVNYADLLNRKGNYQKAIKELHRLERKSPLTNYAKYIKLKILYNLNLKKEYCEQLPTFNIDSLKIVWGIEYSFQYDCE